MSSFPSGVHQLNKFNIILYITKNIKINCHPPFLRQNIGTVMPCFVPYKSSHKIHDPLLRLMHDFIKAINPTYELYHHCSGALTV